MWIKSVHIHNFMSFEDSGEQELSPSTNIIVGQNNAGKTAFLKAVAMRVNDNPHRNSSFHRDHIYNPASNVDVRFVATGSEIRNMMLAHGQTTIPIPFTQHTFAAENLLANFLARNELEFRMRAVNENGWQSPYYPSHQLFSQQNHTHYIIVNTNSQRSGFVNLMVAAGDNDSIGGIAATTLRRKTYYFDAQRLNVGRCPIGNRTELQSNATNLAEVLLVLQDNRRKFDVLNENLRKIFPNLHSISVRPASDDGRLAEIRVWNIDPLKERDDLAIPLNQSGTGIGQVIAILYVVLASDSNVIVIDEPNSFLHPSAARQLVHFLRQNPKHQYIISTHSPETLASAKPDKLFVLRWKDEKTHISTLPKSNIRGVEEALTEVGSRLSDVFGSDAIVWVEGATEEACFPLIFKPADTEANSIINFVALRNTGDLEAKSASAEAIWQIYKKLSTANSLMPRALTFSLDQEGRSSAKIGDLRRLSGQMIKFLPRRMFENYLLHPDAIASVLSALPTFQRASVSATDVENWFAEKGGSVHYFAKGAELTPSDKNWLLKVDGARLLRDLVSDLSETKESYQKVAHAIELTDWIVTNDPAFFDELKTYISELIPAELRI